MLTKSMLRLIDEQRFGYVATVGEDGAPNLSPKGTFLAIDDRTIACGEMRSPNTVRNIAHEARVEVNMIDVFARKGARFKGLARMVMRGDAAFDALYPRWEAEWGPELGAMFNGFLVISIEEAKPLTSPAYDLGADERALRADWLAKFTAQQKAHLG